MCVTRLPLRITGLLAVLLVLGLLGCARTVTTGDSKGSGDRDGKPGPGDDSRRGQAAKLTGEEFAKEWLADKAGTAKKYADGPLEVTGTVDHFSVDLSGKAITLIPCGTGKDKSVLLNVATKTKEPWAVVGPGQQVTVRGRLEKQVFDIPYLQEAEFVDPGPNTSVTLKAADLAAEAARDRKATAEKYKGKGVIVVGKVVRRDEKKTTVFLDGGDKKVIECRTYLVDGPALGTPLEEGKEARVYGVVTGDAPLEQDAVLRMNDCLPILGEK
jgi:hypothetical protein